MQRKTVDWNFALSSESRSSMAEICHACMKMLYTMFTIEGIFWATL